jgi:nitroreductase
MNVVDAVQKRTSIRQFTPQEVPAETLRELLVNASFAPSGGNVQPWRIYVVHGESMVRFRDFLTTQPPLDAPEYEIYPSGLIEPYRTNRFTVGEQMYATLGIEREDKKGRLAQMMRNADFFGSPAAIFCYLDRQMGPPQWSDCGMFLQTFMLLATEAGLATCAQEYWSVRHKAVSAFVGAPDNEILFCGVAVGYADSDAPVNTLRSERMPVEDWVTFL